VQIILYILKSAGGWNPGLSLTINNTPFMPLVIEALDEPGPCGLPALSVAHYGEQNGDLMRDPEMCFELSFAGGIADLNPFYYRQDYIDCEQWSRFITGTDYSCSPDLHRQHASFSKVWDRNLRSQGFIEAFERQRQQAA
jgi:hypothetical protein